MEILRAYELQYPITQQQFFPFKNVNNIEFFSLLNQLWPK